MSPLVPILGLVGVALVVSSIVGFVALMVYHAHESAASDRARRAAGPDELAAQTAVRPHGNVTPTPRCSPTSTVHARVLELMREGDDPDVAAAKAYAEAVS